MSLAENRYYSLLKSIVDTHTKQNNSLVFVTVTKKPTMNSKDAGPLFSDTVEPMNDGAAHVAQKLHIRPEYTFETFAVSSSNQIAYAAATAVAKTPGKAYNPLFFYGGVGVGKTHLMHAVAHTMLAQRISTKIVYCMGEEFLNEIVEAIQTKSARQFKQKYRSADLLLVDDVQFIAGKQTAQEEFFHTFNAISQEGGQIILTSDRPPGEIARLEDRLRSRFEGGLIVDISAPDYELRAAIINIKAKAMGVDITTDVSRIIAANMTDTRAMQGFLKRLSTEMLLHKGPISAETVSSLLAGKSGQSSMNNGGSGGESSGTKKRVTVLEILDAVSAYYNIKTTTLKGPKRDRPIARPRQIIMYLSKIELGSTYDDIGGALGGRDHTTIMHGVDTITRDLSTNPRLREDIEGIKQKLWA